MSQKCFVFGMDSRNRVPSVGMLPPTPVPTPKQSAHTSAKEGAKLSAAPSTAVTASVRRNTKRRPYRSAHDPHAMLPSVMPANSAEVATPIQRSAMLHSYWRRGRVIAMPWIHICVSDQPTLSAAHPSPLSTSRRHWYGPMPRRVSVASTPSPLIVGDRT